MISVLIVEDECIVREALKLLLDEVPDIKVLGTVSTGQEALRFVREEKPQVILLDIHLPDISGFYVAQKILQQYPMVKIIVVTAAAHDIFPLRLLQAGVHGYFTKDASRDELVQGIRSVFSGKRLISPLISNQLALVRTGVNKPSALNILSNREMEIMLMILRGMSSQAIADTLHLSPKTVSTHRINIFKKLKVKNDVELTLFAIQQGLIDAGPIDDENASS